MCINFIIDRLVSILIPTLYVGITQSNQNKHETILSKYKTRIADSDNDTNT